MQHRNKYLSAFYCPSAEIAGDHFDNHTLKYHVRGNRSKIIYTFLRPWKRKDDKEKHKKGKNKVGIRDDGANSKLSSSQAHSLMDSQLALFLH